MAVWDLEKKRAFLVYQVARLEKIDANTLQHISTAELEERELAAYHELHPNLKGHPDYTPSTY